MKKSIRILALFMALTFCTCCLSSCSKLFGKKYTVKWVNYDGTELEVDEKVPAGTVPEYNGEQPERPDDDNYRYEYRGWSPIVLPADADITYIADYTPTHKETGKHLLGGAASWYDDSVTWVMQNKSKILEKVPGGSVICGVFDGVFGLAGADELQSVDPLKEIKEKIDNLQNSIDNGFEELKQLIASSMAKLSDEIKDEINQAERDIETMVLSQTTIANKGDSFDSLMTALNSTERSISAIMNDDTLSDQDKAFSVARLIGSYDQWSNSENLFASYLSFLDAVTKSSYGSTNDKILFDLVYDQQMLHSQFTSEAVANGTPYIDRIIFLAFYAYSISMECITAAMTVANFTEEDLNKLNDTNRAIYASVVSPYSVIVTQSDYLNQKLLKIGFSDTSVMDRITEYFDIGRRGGIIYYSEPGAAGITLSDTLAVKEFSYDMQGYGPIWAMSEFTDTPLIHENNFSTVNSIVDYVKNNYNGTTLREFFSMMGYDVSSIAQNAYFVVGFDCDPDPSPLWGYYNGISIDDPNYNVSEIELLQELFFKPDPSTAVTFK